ncbi:MAG: DUF4214 domain-containing protein [Pseudomonadota bacterium]
MTTAFSQNAVVATPGQVLAMSSLLQLPSAQAPEYLVLVGLDRDRYTAASNGNLGTLEGNGHSLTFAAFPASESDALGLLFTHTASGYYNSSYGYLDAMTFTSSTDQHRSEYLTLYGFGSAGTPDAALHAKLAASLANPFFDGGAFMVAQDYSSASHLGTLDVITDASYVDPTPNAATPQEIAAVAASFVGQAWNDNGCWVLASNIAAMAGASLPLTADEAHPGITPPVANGAWFVAYNSATATAAQQQAWEGQLRPGDVVVSNNNCGGHIATVVAGFGNSAQFIDNSGDSANDGALHDVVIGGAHAMVPWAVGPDLANIVIYRLDTPLLRAVSGVALEAGGARPVAPLFSASDPAGKAVLGYQMYDSGSGSFMVGGVAHSAHTAASALDVSAASLAATSFQAGAAGGADSILVRASNGSYWGDWQAIDVAIGSSVQPAQLHAQADTVYLHGGNSVTLASLVRVNAAGSAITSYTITQPAFGGLITLNGATDLSGTSHNPAGERTYEVSAADFAKLSYVASSYTDSQILSIVAHNGSALASVPALISMSTISPTVHPVTQYLAPGTLVPLSSLFSVSLPDATPVTSYGISTSSVRVIDWGPNTPSHGGTIALNGVTDMLANVDVPAGNFLIAAADLDKVSFRVALDVGTQFIQIWANDGAGGAPGMVVLNTVADSSGILARPASVASGAALAVSALFDASHAGAPLYYRFTDPDHGGALALSHDASNLQSKNDTTPGIYVIRAEELDKMSYIGGASSASEALTVSTSNDMLHWSASMPLQVSTVAAAAPVAPVLPLAPAAPLVPAAPAAPVAPEPPAPPKPVIAVTGTDGADRLDGSDANQAFDGKDGLDTVVMAGPRSHFTVQHGAGGITVTDTSGAQGVDTLVNVERLVFDDGALAFDGDGSAGQLYRLAQAAFDHPADAPAMGRWLDQMDHGGKLAEVAHELLGSAEFSHLYGSAVGDASFVAQMYLNVLHRPGDDAGFGFWVGALEHGMAREELLLSFADSAENHVQLVGAIDNGIAYITFTAPG